MRPLAPATGPIASDRNSCVLACFNAAVDAHYPKRSVLATELDLPEYVLSKMTQGGQAFGLLQLEACSDALLYDFLDRWGRLRGFRIERVDTDRQIGELIKMFEEGVSALVLLQRQREMRDEKERRRA